MTQTKIIDATGLCPACGGAPATTPGHGQPFRCKVCGVANVLIEGLGVVATRRVVLRQACLACGDDVIVERKGPPTHDPLARSGVYEATSAQCATCGPVAFVDATVETTTRMLFLPPDRLRYYGLPVPDLGVPDIVF